MPVKIRLKRIGAKKRPFYRIVVADSRSPRDGANLDEIGFYNPTTNPTTLQIDSEKVRVWLQSGAQPSDTVKVLLVRSGVSQ
ncbi:MAG: 30S ribosomal protein S16 [Syntrophomonadaceae bacterium]|nr:30S ribosomal protein S16 [Bacillota bacterium]